MGRLEVMFKIINTNMSKTSRYNSGNEINEKGGLEIERKGGRTDERINQLQKETRRKNLITKEVKKRNNGKDIDKT